MWAVKKRERTAGGIGLFLEYSCSEKRKIGKVLILVAGALSSAEKNYSRRTNGQLIETSNMILSSYYYIYGCIGESSTSAVTTGEAINYPVGRPSNPAVLLHLIA